MNEEKIREIVKEVIDEELQDGGIIGYELSVIEDMMSELNTDIGSLRSNLEETQSDIHWALSQVENNEYAIKDFYDDMKTLQGKLEKIMSIIKEG